MGETTGIQWSDSTWNVVTGCTRVSPGCDHCYIERQPPFRIHGRKFSGAETGATTGVMLHPDRLEWPFRTGKRALGPRVFVCSLADLFHEDVPDEFIIRVFAVMAETQNLTYQVLTKRPARMRALLNSGAIRAAVYDIGWPLPNVWLGVSAENQTWANARIPILLTTPAEVRFVSYEPALGPLDLTSVAIPHGLVEAKGGTIPGLDWVICGGESGPGARPMPLKWAEDVRDQCASAGVAFFMKQLGAWRFEYKAGAETCVVLPNGQTWAEVGYRSAGFLMHRHGGHGSALEDLPPDLRIREFPQGRSDVAATAAHP
jgi:protein gp37